MSPLPRPRVRTHSPAPSTSTVTLASAAALRIAIEYVPLSALQLPIVKLRKHSVRLQEQLPGSLRKFGFVLPILVDASMTVLSGVALLEAAKRIGLAEVPVVRIEHLGDAEARALSIALNKLTSLSSWDEAALKAEFEVLSSIDFELLSFTGFSCAELDVLTAAPEVKEDKEDLRLDPVVVSSLGDVWVFAGGHRLACLDALDPASYATLMVGEQAGLVISDPPYNVPIRGNVTRRKDAREFAMAVGEMAPDTFTAFLTTTLQHAAAHAREGSLSLQFMDFRHMGEMLAAGHEVYGALFNLCVWAKTNPAMGGPWRSAHELCFVWKNGEAPHVDNVKLGKHGRNRSNVWSYPGANQQRDRGSEGHVTPKNLAMIQDAILDVSNRGDIVLDAFAGSATTLVAAHLARRRGYGLELDPAYVDLGVRRLQARTGAPARHGATGLTFAETAAQRGATSAQADKVSA